MATKINWDEFYVVSAYDFDFDGDFREWRMFITGKVAVAASLKVRGPIKCAFCENTSGAAVEILAPGRGIFFCGRKKCSQDLLCDFSMAQLDAFPMRQVVTVKSTNERAKVTNKKRWQVIRRDNFRCVACGSNDNLVIDHKVPICKGGTSDISNLQTLCFVCNSGKGGE